MCQVQIDTTTRFPKPQVAGSIPAGSAKNVGSNHRGASTVILLHKTLTLVSCLTANADVRPSSEISRLAIVGR